jgi:GT2 family glycosyltransferase
MAYGVVIPNRYPDVIQPLITSLRKFEPDSRVVIVADGHSDSYGYELIKYEEPEFQYAKAVNMGISHLVGLDVILLNDDCVLLEDLTFSRLCDVLRLFPTIGLVSPMIRGCVGNPAQRWHEKPKHWQAWETIKLIHKNVVCFPCVCLRGEMLDQIGYLDETINGYGGEDSEYCQRARLTGWTTAITSQVIVQHGNGGRELASGWGKTWSASFSRRYPHCLATSRKTP